MDKEKRKILRRKLGWIFIKFSVLIHGFFPIWWSYFLGRILGSLAYFLIGRHRKVALESLAVAFPRFNRKERRKIAKDFFIFMAESSFELLYFLKHQKAFDNIYIEGKEYLDLGLKEKKGIIIVTAHIGNFPLMSVKLVKEGYSVNFLTRPMRDKKTGDYLYDLRTKAGVKTIFSYPRRECILKIINALRNNELVIIQMDQNFGTGGVWVNFFGKLAATPTGAVNLALKTGSPIICGYIFRFKPGKHIIRFFPKEELIITQNKDETILLNVINITRKIESWIKKHPSEWSWIHRRWKSQPSLKISKVSFKIEEI